MNIQQFQYILAVAETKHFENAANQCFISQSTLSTMISKFEDELGIKIFDRKKKPVALTSEGAILIEQLKVVKREIDQLSELSKQIKGEVSGDLKIAVIPTIAPFLLPMFLQKFANDFPGLQIQVTEQTTAEIMRKLKSRELDMGIISIPVLDADIVETRLYDEPFLFYNSVGNSNKTIPAEEMDMSKLCLLEEGHCMRTQVLNLCDLHKRKLTNKLNFNYKAGSIDSLLRFVKANNATTLLPFLSTVDMPVEERSKLRSISNPVPFRSIGIAVHRHFVKDKVLSALVSCIQEVVKLKLPQDDISGEMLMPMQKQG